VWTLSFSPDDRFVASGSHSGHVNIFGVESGKKEGTLETRGKFVMSIAYSPDGKQMVTGAIDGIVHLFDLATGKLIKTLKGMIVFK
jgi:WD repeat-containing protein 61